MFNTYSHSVTDVFCVQTVHFESDNMHYINNVDDMLHVCVCVCVCNESCHTEGGSTPGYYITFSALISILLQLPGKTTDFTAPLRYIIIIRLPNCSSSVSHINTNGPGGMD